MELIASLLEDTNEWGINFPFSVFYLVKHANHPYCARLG
jgi:hypothetical protein